MHFGLRVGIGRAQFFVLLGHIRFPVVPTIAGHSEVLTLLPVCLTPWGYLRNMWRRVSVICDAESFSGHHLGMSIQCVWTPCPLPFSVMLFTYGCVQLCSLRFGLVVDMLAGHVLSALAGVYLSGFVGNFTSIPVILSCLLLHCLSDRPLFRVHASNLLC